MMVMMMTMMSSEKTTAPYTSADIIFTTLPPLCSNGRRKKNILDTELLHQWPRQFCVGRIVRKDRKPSVLGVTLASVSLLLFAIPVGMCTVESNVNMIYSTALARTNAKRSYLLN